MPLPLLPLARNSRTICSPSSKWKEDTPKTTRIRLHPARPSLLLRREPLSQTKTFGVSLGHPPPGAGHPPRPLPPSLSGTPVSRAGNAHSDRVRDPTQP
jgi:hypothetical protein